MQTIDLTTTFVPTYRNHGQAAEQLVRFVLTGEVCKADNVPATVAGDVLDIQIKSARATVCKGTDLDAYMALDAAKRYGYVTSDLRKMYLMTPDEWREFVGMFASATRDSRKNGGKLKLRLKNETRAMREWLSTRA